MSDIFGNNQNKIGWSGSDGDFDCTNALSDIIIEFDNGAYFVLTKWNFLAGFNLISELIQMRVRRRIAPL